MFLSFRIMIISLSPGFALLIAGTDQKKVLHASTEKK